MVLNVYNLAPQWQDLPLVLMFLLIHHHVYIAESLKIESQIPKMEDANVLIHIMLMLMMSVYYVQLALIYVSSVQVVHHQSVTNVLLILHQPYLAE